MQFIYLVPFIIKKEFRFSVVLSAHSTFKFLYFHLRFQMSSCFFPFVVTLYLLMMILFLIYFYFFGGVGGLGLFQFSSSVLNILNRF